jgi:muramoyltetrapeptide carboxypeptidase
MKNIVIKPNDEIALTCPGSRCDSQHQVIQTAEYLTQKYQLRSCYQKETFEPHPAKTRAEILCQYLFDPNIRLIWMLRGGEGSADLIPMLHEKQNAIKKLPPKLIMGFSDITALLLYFSQHYNWPVIHGFNARQLALQTISPLSEKLTFDFLFNGKCDLTLPLEPLNAAAEKNQQLTGFITGGNLSLINISVQDTWEIQTKDKLLFLEDVNEKPHAVLRTLKYFDRVGLFKNIQAVILGQFICAENQNKVMQRTLKKWSQTVDKPIWRTSHIGHGKDNAPIPFYRKCHLDATDTNQAALYIGCSFS